MVGSFTEVVGGFGNREKDDETHCVGGDGPEVGFYG